MKDITLVNHLNSLAGSSPGKTEKTAAGFADTLSKIIKETNEQQMTADRAIEKLNTGEEKNINYIKSSGTKRI